jgi:hypothetical protein
MPAELPSAGFRLPGAYQLLLGRERHRVVEQHPAVDPRLMLWDPEITSPQEREAAWAEARANPLPSELLDRLERGEPVIVDRLQLGIGGNSLPLPPDAPAWTRDFRNVHRIRVRTEDVIAPVYDD